MPPRLVTRLRRAAPAPQDAYLPQRLLDKLMYTYNYIEMARVTGQSGAAGRAAERGGKAGAMAAQ